MTPEKAREIIRLRCEQGDTHDDCAELLRQAVALLGEDEAYQNPQMISMIYPTGTGRRGGLKAIYTIDRTVVEVQVYPNPQSPKRRSPNREQRQET